MATLISSGNIVFPHSISFTGLIKMKSINFFHFTNIQHNWITTLVRGTAIVAHSSDPLRIKSQQISAPHNPQKSLTRYTALLAPPPSIIEENGSNNRLKARAVEKAIQGKAHE